MNIVLIEYDNMREAARRLWFESGLAADLSGAASVAALLCGKVRAHKGERVCTLVSGAGPDGSTYRQILHAGLRDMIACVYGSSEIADFGSCRSGAASPLSSLYPLLLQAGMTHAFG